MAEINRLVWEKGDFGAVAPMGWDVGEVVVAHVGVEQGERVLDVACGTGNAAIRAAQRGGTVTGLDIVPALLDQGRALAAEAGVEVEFVEGEPEELTFEDTSFDVVLSMFACMFVPDHKRAACEIVVSSDVFASPDNAADLAILAPTDGEVLTSRVVTLVGQVVTTDDELAVAGLTWRSSVDGELGAGAMLDVELSPGTHELTLVSPSKPRAEARVVCRVAG